MERSCIIIKCGLRNWCHYPLTALWRVQIQCGHLFGYLGGHRFHFSLFLLILLVSPKIRRELFAPAGEETEKHDISAKCESYYLTLQSFLCSDTDPLMISLLSPRMNISCSVVTMQSPFLWPVLGSASVMSVHRFRFTVP